MNRYVINLIIDEGTNLEKNIYWNDVDGLKEVHKVLEYFIDYPTLWMSVSIMNCGGPLRELDVAYKDNENKMYDAEEFIIEAENAINKYKKEEELPF